MATSENNQIRKGSQGMSSGAVIQYLTEVFTKNNNDTLHRLAQDAVVSFHQNPDEMDLDVILNKAVFAAIYNDFCKTHLMDRTDCFADIVKKYIDEIAEYEVELKNQTDCKKQ